MRYNSGDLFGYAALTFTLHFSVHAESGVACKDSQGRSYESGYHYVPGNEPCTVCMCDNGNPKACTAFICRFPEENCKSFRRGNTCCEFICLDDALSSMSNEKSDSTGGTSVDGNANYDIGLRSVASFVTAILSLSLLFFLIHRLRQRKIRVCVAGRQSRQLADEQRNLNTMGYLERGGLQHGVPMDDMPCGGGYPLWKPPGNYCPRGEAPPPYEEAVAAARAEQALLSMSPHALSPLNFSSGYLPPTNTHTSVAVVTTNHDTRSSNSPSSGNNNLVHSSSLMTSANRPLDSPNMYMNYNQSSQNETTSMEINASTSTNFTIARNTYENLPSAIGMQGFTDQHAGRNNQITQPFSNSHSTIAKSYRQHTTLPRQGGAFTISATLSSSNVSTHRTIPRTLSTRNGTKMKEIVSECTTDEYFHPPPRNASSENSAHSTAPIASNDKEIAENITIFPKDITGASLPPVLSATDQQSTSTTTKACDFEHPLNLHSELNDHGSFESVACTCSIQALPTLHDDADDYRSECENCKSTTGSRYYLDNEDELVTSPHETMTLHRRPEETTASATPQYYRTSLTLPTSTRQRTRSSGIRDNWFNTMPQSSTESSDEN